MALEGSLREFNLADILQLLYFQKKTGVLALQGTTDKVRLLFHEGNIVGADSKQRASENRIGTVLVRRGIITEDALSAAVEKQKTEGGKMGSVLVKEGIATREQIQEVITFQINEIMVQLFSWKEGKYEFTPQSVPLDKDIGLVLDTQHFLMEGLRMVDEWSEIEDRININTVFVRKSEEIPGGLGEEEQEILGMVDGESNVATISDFSGKDSFSVSMTLLGLMDKGLISKKVAPGEIKVQKAAKAVSRPIPGLSIMILLFLLSALALSGFLSAMKTSERIKPSLASAQVDALRYQVLAEFKNKGSLPSSVEGRDPWGSPFIYEPLTEGFRLLSPGPDRTPGTGDDIN